MCAVPHLEAASLAAGGCEAAHPEPGHGEPQHLDLVPLLGQGVATLQGAARGQGVPGGGQQLHPGAGAQLLAVVAGED